VAITTEDYVQHFNEVRLHSAFGYVTPSANLAGQEALIFAERDRKLENARERRQKARRESTGRLSPTTHCSSRPAALR